MSQIIEHKDFEVGLDFLPPGWLFSPHLETIIPSTLRKSPLVDLRRERLELPDGDFIDLDWNENQHKKLVILSHGLEGGSRRPYILGMIKTLKSNGFDSLAWNCRSCSEELNRLPRLYHHADYHDLDFVISEAVKKGYEELFLLGFSMGGNLTLHWLYEFPHKASQLIKKAVAISSPLDLKSSAMNLMRSKNFIYKNRFLSKLKKKIRAKAVQFPDVFDLSLLKKVDSFYSLDELFTAPIHGFQNAEDFYQKGSTKHKLSSINTPTLLIQALNDPFFTDSCFPNSKEINNANIHLCYQKFGGHVGFTIEHNKRYFSEEMSVRFLES